METLHQLGIDAASAGENDSAVRYWEAAWAIDPNHAGVVERLEREHLARGMEAWALGDIDEAVAHWNAVLRVTPRNERALGYLRRAYELDARLKEIVRESQTAEADE